MKRGGWKGFGVLGNAGIGVVSHQAQHAKATKARDKEWRAGGGALTLKPDARQRAAANVRAKAAREAQEWIADVKARRVAREAAKVTP